jgi:hypothetical protein
MHSFKSVSLLVSSSWSFACVGHKICDFSEVSHVIRFPFIRRTDVSARNFSLEFRLKNKQALIIRIELPLQRVSNINTVELSILLLLWIPQQIQLSQARSSNVGYSTNKQKLLVTPATATLFQAVQNLKFRYFPSWKSVAIQAHTPSPYTNLLHTYERQRFKVCVFLAAIFLM